MAPQLSIDDARRSFVPPRELGVSRPRDVRLTAGGKAVVAVTFVLLLAAVSAGVILYRMAVRQAGIVHALSAEGADTGGVVTRLWRSGDKEHQPWVSYRFAANGRDYEGRTQLRLSRWQGLQVGSLLPVRYLPSDPSRNYGADTPPNVLPIWLPFVVAAAIGTLGVLCVCLIHVQRRMLMEGRAAPAVVTAHKKHHTSHGGTHRSMTYTFPLLSGATAEGKAGTSSKPPGIGTVICILYDPERPRRSMPYPLSLVRPG